MATPFLGEVKIVSFNFPPKGWAFCNGQLLPINQNQALFSILGTTYGGDGRVNFALPDLRGRTPVYVGNGIVLGERSGEENHTLNTTEMPMHNHLVNATTTAANQFDPTDLFMAKPTANIYAATNNLIATGMQVTNTGGSQPHNNLQPYLVLNFIIALQGVFPSQN